MFFRSSPNKSTGEIITNVLPGYDFNDGHNVVTIIGVDFINKRSICCYYLKGKGRSGALFVGINSRTLTSP